MEISIPYTPWRVPAQAGKNTYTVNLSPNGDIASVARSSYSGGSTFRRRLVAIAIDQLRTDAYWATREALGNEAWWQIGEDDLFAYTITMRWSAKGKLPDDDNVLGGTKHLRDGVAMALTIDDKRMIYEGPPKIERLPHRSREETIFTISKRLSSS